MERISSLIVFNLFIFLSANAQKISVIEATSQNWAGGICCSYGINYHFKIQFARSCKEPIPDTIWINGRDFPLSPKLENGPGNLQIDKKGKTYVFTFDPGFTEDNSPKPYPDGHIKQKPLPAPAPRPYSEAALLSYHFKGKSKRYFYVLPAIKPLPPLNYP